MEMRNHECYVSLEVAKLLKQAGFDWGCDFFYGLDVRYRGKSIGEYKEYELKAKGKGSKIEYVDGGKVYNFYHSNKEGEDYGGYSRPTLEVAQRWLREVKGYILEITAVRKNPDDVYKTYIEYWYNIFEEGKCDGHYDTYEKAQEAGIKKALEIILEKGK